MKRKVILMFITLMVTLGAQAQFEKDTWYFNLSSTGLDLSHSKYGGTSFGLQATGGAFIANNVALLVNVEGKYVKHGVDETGIGTQLRYYLSSNGLYGGLGLKYKHLSGDIPENKNLAFIVPEAGYTFFLGRNLTIEPAIYYDMSLKDFSTWSKYGLKIGFGFYFK